MKYVTMEFFCVAVLVRFLSVPTVVSANRVERRTGDQAPEGQCLAFSFGGVSRIHSYVCCNNYNQSPNNCDGHTYQGGSTNKYCGSRGKDTKAGNGNMKGAYHCGGCLGQNRTFGLCMSNIRRVYEYPGFCRLFASCFKDHCKDEYTRADNVPDTCYNLVCDPGEDVNNCPNDCCGTENETCDWTTYSPGDNTCPPICCATSTCCRGTGIDLNPTLLAIMLVFSLLKQVQGN